ncbi:DUF1540 domain-containing protein [Streptomyces griseoincarnatus]|uniref:DUF1540 domain-containing protein n=1 Tax=unclassified Streptomyces TaxID=2593676 RepID=UPI0018EEC6E5|nr:MULTISPECIES: DUF1540 domain-containing protein [unclassified Streptomyces]MCA2205180.1 DUF1540 domain-containing protein [Streptomyces sp. SMS_SU21]
MTATPVMQLPVISECAAEDCAYNHGHACHAAAITVGDLDSPVCDTFMGADLEGGEPSTTGRVGACKMADCRHNSGLECHAPAITVGLEHEQVNCLTYERT